MFQGCFQNVERKGEKLNKESAFVESDFQIYPFFLIAKPIFVIGKPILVIHQKHTRTPCILCWTNRNGEKCREKEDLYLEKKCPLPLDGWLSFTKRGQRSLVSSDRFQRETDEH